MFIIIVETSSTTLSAEIHVELLQFRCLTAAPGNEDSRIRRKEFPSVVPYVQVVQQRTYRI